MQRPSLLVSIADLMIMFLYGLALCYYDNFIAPMSGTTQLLISFITALFLGSMGPNFDEVFEWIIFFALGVLVVFLYPTAMYAYQTNTLALQEFILAIKAGSLYTARILAAWLVGIPMGFVFHKITDTKYYRHNSF